LATLDLEGPARFKSKDAGMSARIEPGFFHRYNASDISPRASPSTLNGLTSLLAKSNDVAEMRQSQPVQEKPQIGLLLLGESGFIGRYLGEFFRKYSSSIEQTVEKFVVPLYSPFSRVSRRASAKAVARLPSTSSAVGILSRLMRLRVKRWMFSSRSIFAPGDERDGLAALARAAGPANPMDVIFAVVRQVVIKDDLVHIQSARHDIGSDDELHFPFAEPAHDALAHCRGQWKTRGFKCKVGLLALN
jgi:hypothetical protein